jgi:diguanylate cyclase (GGDEF)-like protein
VKSARIPNLLRTVWAEMHRMYAGTDAESARIRAAHLGAVTRLTPYTMAANAGSAALVLAGYGLTAPAGMWLWLAVVLTLSGAGLLAWWRGRGRNMTTASPRAVNRATLHAALLAGSWAMMPLVWFGSSSPGQQLLVATLVAGMLGAGAFVLSPLPRASLAYGALYTLSAAGALAQAQEPLTRAVGALLCLYGPTVAIGSISSWRKATQLLQSQAASVRQERMLALLLQDFEQHAGEALWETGIDGCLVHLSPRLAELLGVEEDEARTLPLLMLLGRRGPAAAAALSQALDSARPFRELPLALQRGMTAVHLSMNGKPLVDERGRTVGWRGVLADVSERVQGEQRLWQLAHTDSLTGLANRFALRDALAEAVRQQQAGALLTVDLDHFKSINDTLGHTAGDELLKAVAQRLRGCVRPGDLVARLGGDEFAVLMRQAQGADADALARRLIHALGETLEVQGRHMRISSSVGVATPGGDVPTGVEELLMQADTALYVAKESGRGRHALYVPAMGERSRRRAELENGLRRALEHGGLSLHWQPKVDIGAWHICGAEALLRWDDALGRGGPAEFIGVAEQCGLIDELGLWALREACRAATGPLAALTVSVNVSPLQLRDRHFVDRVREVLKETGLVPGRLELEITESVFIDDADGALAHLHALRGLGLRVALDDFGTGYSSLAYLRRFPFDTLKIDRAFVNEVLMRRDTGAIVQMIAQLASTLGMRTVCEGVETTAQLDAVARAGCHEVQGYLVSPPRPLADFQRFRRAWHEGRPPSFALH